MKEPENEMYDSDNTAVLSNKFVFWLVILFIIFISVFNK
jgi:hypothetical protein